MREYSQEEFANFVAGNPHGKEGGVGPAVKKEFNIVENPDVQTAPNKESGMAIKEMSMAEFQRAEVEKMLNEVKTALSTESFFNKQIVNKVDATLANIAEILKTEGNEDLKDRYKDINAELVVAVLNKKDAVDQQVKDIMANKRDLANE